MKTLMLLIFAAATPALASSNFDDMVANAACRKQLLSAAGVGAEHRNWFPKVIANTHHAIMPGISFRDTRSQQALEIWKEEHQSHIRKMDLKAQTQTTISFDEKRDCAQSSEDGALKAPHWGDANGFTDVTLQALMKKNKKGLIYVWTPYMPLSIDGLKEIKAAAKAKGLPVQILVDGNAVPDDIKGVLSKGLVTADDVSTVRSDELLARELGVHYPALYLYENRYLANRVYNGYKKADVYARWVDYASAEVAKDLK